MARRTPAPPTTLLMSAGEGLVNGVLTASIKDKLWHRMRGDLAQYVPQIESNQLLMPSGRLMRRQFFEPLKTLSELPSVSQMIFDGSADRMAHDAPVWAASFSFSFEQAGICHVVMRNFGIAIPVSQDPRQPIARHLRFAPSKYKLRPDFTAVFDCAARSRWARWRGARPRSTWPAGAATGAAATAPPGSCSAMASARAPRARSCSNRRPARPGVHPRRRIGAQARKRASNGEKAAASIAS